MANTYNPHSAPNVLGAEIEKAAAALALYRANTVGEAAKLLRVSRRTMQLLIKRYGLDQDNVVEHVATMLDPSYFRLKIQETVGQPTRSIPGAAQPPQETDSTSPDSSDQEHPGERIQ